MQRKCILYREYRVSQSCHCKEDRELLCRSLFHTFNNISKNTTWRKTYFGTRLSQWSSCSIEIMLNVKPKLCNKRPTRKPTYIMSTSQQRNGVEGTRPDLQVSCFWPNCFHWALSPNFNHGKKNNAIKFYKHSQVNSNCVNTGYFLVGESTCFTTTRKQIQILTTYVTNNNSVSMHNCSSNTMWKV